MSATAERARTRDRSSLAAWAFAALMLLEMLSFLAVRVGAPYDGARVQSAGVTWRPDGVVVTPLVEGDADLRAGDVVVAFEGRSIEAWVRDRLTLQPRSARYSVGDTVTYTVVRDGVPQEVPVTLGRYPIWSAILAEWGNLLFMLVFQVVSTFVYLRRPSDRSARALFVLGWGFGQFVAYSVGFEVADLTGQTVAWPFFPLSFALYLTTLGASLHFTMVFPSPPPFVARRDWLIPAAYLGSFGLFLALVLGRLPFEPNVLAWISWWYTAAVITAIVYFVLLVSITVSSYVAQPDRLARQKVRLVAEAMGVSVVASLAIWLIPVAVSGRPLLGINSIGLLLLPIPVAITVAIFRNRLFDIDVIVNRTLVYGSLTGTLVLFYFVSILLLQRLLAVLGFRQSEVAVALTTLAIASLANPLRQRIQSDIDRRLYRRKYDAAQAMVAFSVTARAEVDIEKLASRLVTLVDETMQPSHVSIWLRDRGKPASQP